VGGEEVVVVKEEEGEEEEDGEKTQGCQCSSRGKVPGLGDH